MEAVLRPLISNSIFRLRLPSPETEQTVPMYQENPVERRQAVQVLILYHIELEVAILVDITHQEGNNNLSWFQCAPLNQHLIHC